MKNIFKNFTASVIWLSIMAILLGILMVAFPGAALIASGVTFAAYLIVHGLTLIILDIKAWSLYIPYDGMLRGILCVLLGILIVAFPETLAINIGVLVGMWIIISAIDGIRLASVLRGTDAPWVLMIIIDIIDVILGVLMLFSPVITALSTTVGLGIVLIVHSVISLVDMINLKKNVKETEKLIKEKIA